MNVLKKIRKKPILKKIALGTSALTLSVGLMTSFDGYASSAVDDDEETGWFEEKIPFGSGVVCGSGSYTRTTYYNTSGSVVGILFIQNGVVQTTYSGSYSTKTTESGTQGERTLYMNKCEDFSFTSCTPCISPCVENCSG